MSEWRKAEKDDIDIDEEYGEIFLNLWIESNDQGNIYTQIKWSDIEEKLEEFDKKRNN